MRKALSLAAKGKGMCHPNPMVGAVIARGGEIIGSGYHHGPHTPHAEIEALEQAGDRAAGAVLYVTLEPCNHQGRTPPCTEAILQAGVDRVVIAAMDPNPGVKGGGAERIRAAGLKVESGLMAEESSRLNAAYEKYVLTGKPLVTVKMAATADGKVAARGGASRWITGEKARREVHAMRRESDAVMVGKGTVKSDDPELTVRMVPMRGARPPVRIIVDSRLEISPDSRLALGGEPHVIVATTREHDRDKADYLSARGVEVMVVSERAGQVDLDHLLAVLGEREIAQLLVEGGPTLVASFFEQSLADRLALFIAPKVFGDKMAPSWIEGREVSDPGQAISLGWSRVRRIGDDLLLEGEIFRSE
ncbi:MAG: bifunctional diaminohydroxyphosphoribosylaminopyrimidine deaminase/5-amino-6-(5-phosphoribosylamino)uracil reductase RibD [Actinobacteria bacterium]|nr:bifunctional diaminohydroxyphosphoribosylaminopyrimidine deaminase/5-amino-6-(5-phosphoribosylamino)uracil reductase RibD [Actinomycetota bacterium]